MQTSETIDEQTQNDKDLKIIELYEPIIKAPTLADDSNIWRLYRAELDD